MHDASRSARSAVRWTVAGLAAYAILGGSVTLVGWFAGLPRLTDWVASGISMFANTAFAAICAGMALLLMLARKPWATQISRALGIVVALIGGGTLFQHLSGIDLPIDTVLIQPPWGNKAAVSPGRMGPPASICFTLLGIALLLSGTGGRQARRASSALGIVVCGLSVLSLMGYVSGANPLFAVARFTGIALQTASILFGLALAVVASVPQCEPMRTLQQDSAAGLLARRSLPFIVVVPIALGSLRDYGRRAGWFDQAMGTSLLVLVLVMIFSGLLWWWVGAVSKYEQALRASEQAEMMRRAEVEASEERLSLALRGGEMGAWETDLETGEIFWDDRIAAMLGIAREKAARELRRWTEFIYAKDHDRVTNAFRVASEAGTPFNEEFRVVDADGSIRWFSSRGMPVIGNGRRRRMIGVAMDITDRKKTEEKLRETQRELLIHAADLEAVVAERTAKLQESVNELQSFSYTIAHDMRAPLRAMGAFAHLLKNEIAAGTVSPDASRFCERIVVGAARLDNLINDALNYTKAALQEFPLQPVDLARLVRGLVDTYPNLHADHADIRFDTNLPVVLGNESLLTQCFSNLLGNAVKFVALGMRPHIRLYSQIEDGIARVWVEDNGIGIPRHAQVRLFAMFQKLDNQYEGTGIGLAIVRKVVERMGGKVGVESEPDRGSRFWVELRLAPKKEPHE
jgi:PAS domain S-box-containing protein